MIYGKALLLSKQILRTHMQIKRGFSGTSKSQNSHIFYVANTLDKDATPSAELPRIFRRASAKFLQRNGRFLLTCNSCSSYKADFSWQGSLNIRMRYPENGWYEENDYIAFASASFRKKKHKKPSAGFRDCSPVPFSKFYDTILHIIMSKINDAAHLEISTLKNSSWTPTGRDISKLCKGQLW